VSGAGDRSAEASRAMDVEAQAAAWLRHRHFWNWTQDEQAKLDAWLTEALAHRVAFWRLNAALARTERLAALRPADPEERAAANGRVWPMVLRVTAACAIVAVLGAAGVSYYPNAQEETYATPVGGREVITLGDGSHVELNTDTVLRARANHRAVELVRGEAYFQIRHDAAHPFAVTVGGHRVTDLGTKFLIRDEPDHVEVALIEGRARIDAIDKGRAHSAVLTPGDVAVATADKMSITTKSTQSLVSALGWRSGVLVFKYTTLAEAAAEFNRYNRKKLVIADSASARLTIVGTFPVDDVAAFTDVVQDIMRLRVAQRGDEIVISR
jgi:transmembrane sensor